MSSKKEVILNESMKQRIMELAGTKAFYKKPILKEGEEFPKKEEDPVEEEEVSDKSLPAEEKTVEPTSDSSEEEDMLSNDLLDSDIEGEDLDSQTMDSDEFVNQLADLVLQHFGIQLTVGPASEDSSSVLDTDIEGDVSESPEDTADDVNLEPEVDLPKENAETEMPTKLENKKKKVSPMAQQIYEQVMARIVKKSGVSLKESQLRNQEVKVKLEPKQQAATKKPLNEAKDGQPHSKAPHLTSKLTPAPAKGTGPNKQGPTPKPHPQPIKSSPKPASSKKC